VAFELLSKVAAGLLRKDPLPAERIGEAFAEALHARLALAAGALDAESIGKPGGPYREENYREALAHLQEYFPKAADRLRRERLDGAVLTEELRRQPQVRRKWLVRNMSRFRSYGLAERLLRLNWSLWHSDPREAENLSEVILEIAEQLDEILYGPFLLSDLRARALCHLANSRRLLRHLRSVEETFQAAEFYLDRGSGDPAERASFLLLKAYLRHDERRLDEANEFLDEAARIYQAQGNLRQEATVLLKKASLLQDSARNEEALEILRQVSALTQGHESQLYFFAYHNITDLLALMGRTEEALDRIQAGQELAMEAGGAIDRLKVDWLAGRLLADVDRLDRAQEVLETAKASFLEQEMGFEAVCVALDLAEVYLRSERRKDAEGLIFELPAYLRSSRVAPSVFEALHLLQQRLREGSASAKLVREVADFLDVAGVDPSAVFTPSN